MENALIHASLGRCGSWWFCNSVIKNYSNFHSFYNFGDINFNKNTLYKTHDFPPPNIAPYMKIVYMFGCPMNIIVSALEKFDYKVHKNVHQIYSPWEAFYKYHNADILEHHKIYDKDTLRLEENFDMWYKPQRFPFVAIKYETLSKIDLNRLYNFLGFKFDLIPFKKRESNWQNHPQKDRLLSTYKSLADKVERAEPIKFFEPISLRIPE